jgi:hypothetical protein
MSLQAHLGPSGSLGAVTVDTQRGDEALRDVSETFDVNPVVARIRIDELYPAQGLQMHL